MGKKETVEVLVDGGKASAGPAMGSTLGPLKVDIAKVLAKINEDTKDFKGMKVPVKVIVDVDTKDFTLTIGTPPASQLIKSELGLKKGSGAHKKYSAGMAYIEQIIKVAKMKQSNLIINNLKSGVKTVVGSCRSLGILIEGKTPQEVIKEIDAGVYDKEIDAGLTEVPASKKEALAEVVAKMESSKDQHFRDMEAKKASDEAKAAKKAAKVESAITKK
jgi:large subunit ribosomal protein L11